MTEVTAKAIPGADRLRAVFRRVLEGAGRLAGRKPEEPQAEAQTRQQRTVEMVERYQTQFNERVDVLAKRVTSGELPLRQFRALMLNEIRYSLYTGAAAGAGGIGYLTPEDIQRVDEHTRAQAVYLDNWIAQLEREPVEARKESRIANRARMYGGAGTQIAYETMDKNVHRNFPDLPFYPKDRTDCRNNCKCGWVWRYVDAVKGNADVDWQMQPAEHCRICINRAKACNPLKIRDFKIINMPPMEGLVRRD